MLTGPTVSSSVTTILVNRKGTRMKVTQLDRESRPRTNGATTRRAARDAGPRAGRLARQPGVERLVLVVSPERSGLASRSLVLVRQMPPVGSRTRPRIQRGTDRNRRLANSRTDGSAGIGRMLTHSRPGRRRPGYAKLAGDLAVPTLIRSGRHCARAAASDRTDQVAMQKAQG